MNKMNAPPMYRRCFSDGSLLQNLRCQLSDGFSSLVNAVNAQSSAELVVLLAVVLAVGCLGYYVYCRWQNSFERQVQRQLDMAKSIVDVTMKGVSQIPVPTVTLSEHMRQRNQPMRVSNPVYAPGDNILSPSDSIGDLYAYTK